MIDNLLAILSTLTQNYTKTTEPLIKLYDFHVLLCLMGLFIGELYKAFLKGNFQYSYNICFMSCLASLTLTCWFISMPSTPHFLRQG